ncbi:hypothetical protein LTR95_016134 [Oleoguttula sp. CCFEE 5521]
MRLSSSLRRPRVADDLLQALGNSIRTPCPDSGLVRLTRAYATPQWTARQQHLDGRSERCSRSSAYDRAVVRRSFATSPTWQKKSGGKPSQEAKQANPKSSVSAEEDPYDFSALEADIASSIERLKTDLSKLRAGGRFDPEVVENLRVQPQKSSNQTVKLSDVAQVIPKGRTVQVMVGESDHLKPVSTAISSSTLSLTPQSDPTGSNPLLLLLNIPPPTADSRRATLAEATKAGEKASTAVRDARGKQQKKLRALQLAKSVRPDDLKKAGGMMEKVVEKGSAEVKRVVDGARKVLDSG